jgi:phage tail sheath gpL-like
MDFSLIPSDAIQPLFYAEVDSTKAGGAGGGSRPTLLMGQMLPTGTAVAAVPVRLSSASEASALFENGSQLQRMAEAYFANDPFTEVWAIPLADVGVAKATDDLSFVGTSSAAGVLSLYIGGRLLSISAPSGTTPTALGDLIEDALGVNEAAAVVLSSTYPVTASNAAGVVTFTARNAGLEGNTIDLRVNWLGAAGGERLPAGVTITELPSGTTHVQLATGAVNPTLTTAITAMGDESYSYVVQPWTDATSLDAWQTEFADSTAGRWGPVRGVYGTVFTADNAPYSVLSGAGIATAKNEDPHMTAFVIEGCPTPACELAAAYAGVCAASLRNDRARPLNTLGMAGVKAPAKIDQFIYAERDVLLKLGLTTPMISSDGTVRIQRAVSTRTENAFGASDIAYRDITTAETLDQCLTEMEALITNKYGRVKLVGDSDMISPGAAVATPSMVKADLIAQYNGWVRAAYMEDADTFASLLVVERNATDPNRLDVLWQPDLANGLMIFAVLAAFRLQYTAAEVSGA